MQAPIKGLSLDTTDALDKSKKKFIFKQTFLYGLDYKLQISAIFLLISDKMFINLD